MKKKFEYIMIHKIFDLRAVETLNKFGQEGWELVGVSDYYFYLKREI